MADLILNRHKFETMEVRVKDLRATVLKDPDNPAKRARIDHLTVNGRELKPSQRFHTSLMAKFGFSKSIYNLFDHDEVFDRISDRFPNDRVVLTVETPPEGHKHHGQERLLAVSSPTAIRVNHDELLGLLSKYDINTEDADYGLTNGRIRPRLITEDTPARHNEIILPGIDHSGPTGAWENVQVAVPSLSYEDGVIRSIHTPNNNREINILGDAFSNRFVMDCPIDGYGKPSLYLMLLRLICTNGAIAFSPTFRAELSLGKKEDNFEYAMVRAFEGYNNEEGFNCLAEKFESAGRSWASISEVDKVYKALAIMHNTSEIADHVWSTAQDEARKAHAADDNVILQSSPVMRSFHNICGDLHRSYGLANLSALGVKRQRTLPAGLSVYELINFVSEVATHYAKPSGNRRLQGIIGEMVSAEYDLEGTKEKFPDWKAYMVQDSDAAESLAMANGNAK